MQIVPILYSPNHLTAQIISSLRRKLLPAAIVASGLDARVAVIPLTEQVLNEKRNMDARTGPRLAADGKEAIRQIMASAEPMAITITHGGKPHLLAVSCEILPKFGVNPDNLYLQAQHIPDTLFSMTSRGAKTYAIVENKIATQFLRSTLKLSTQTEYYAWSKPATAPEPKL